MWMVPGSDAWTRPDPRFNSPCFPQTHTYFLLLGVEHAYVSSIGQFIGIVTLRRWRTLASKTTYPGWEGERMRSRGGMRG